MDEAEIFIQIASYRDPQLAPTVVDLIEKATHPDRLRIGLCIELTPEDASRCGPASLPSGAALKGARLRVDVSPAQESRGCCAARSRTQRLWQQEAFTLQIDSHSRFLPGWDVGLLAMWERCQHRRAVITSYPNAFRPPDHYETDHLPLLAAHRFDENGILRLLGINTYRLSEQLPPEPLPGAFASGCMLFGPGEMIREVPYDPGLYFYGEEISLAIRLWSHGFNLYNPDRLLMFHLYKPAGVQHVTHWADHPDWDQLDRHSVQRVQALLLGEGLEAPYGLGTARSLAEWQHWSGVDLRRRTISAEARAGRFSPPPPCAPEARAARG